MIELTAAQVRVLGCLIEKGATTPEHYPLTSKALTTACNQKNNREPIASYTEREVDAVMLELRQLGLARTVHSSGARVPKHRHVLDEAWDLTLEQLTVLAITMLRGPNTLNELLSRTERYVAFDGVPAVRDAVATLERRDPPMVVELDRQPGQRETRFTHLLDGGTGDTPPMEVRDSTDRSSPAPQQTSSASPPAAPEDEIAALRAALAALESRFDELLRRLGETI